MTVSMSTPDDRPTGRRTRGARPATLRRVAGVLALSAGALVSSPIGQAADPESVNIRLEVTSTSGSPITQISQGSRFALRAFAEDTGANPEGVFAAYLDVTFDSSLAALGSPVTYGDDFPNGHREVLTAGHLDNVGAFAGLPPTGPGELFLFSVELTADAPGQLEFTGGAPDDSALYWTLVYGFDFQVNDVTFGSTSVEIVETPVPVESFFLPKKVTVRENARDANKSKLTAVGFIDTGPEAVSLTAGAMLDIGGATFQAFDLSRKGNGAYVYQSEGLDFGIVPHKSGSSRAKFKLKVVGDVVGQIDPGAPLTLRFRDGDIDATGTVGLDSGKFTLGKQRGALEAPVLYFYAAKAKLKGGGKDALKLKAGLGSLGGTPANAPDVTVALGPSYVVTIPGGDFTRKGGDAFVFKGQKPGVTSVVLDYGRETMRFTAKDIDLGDLPAGPQPVLVTIGAGDPNAVMVRMVRSGKKLSY